MHSWLWNQRQLRKLDKTTQVVELHDIVEHRGVEGVLIGEVHHRKCTANLVVDVEGTGARLTRNRHQDDET